MIDTLSVSVSERFKKFYDACQAFVEKVKSFAKAVWSLIGKGCTDLNTYWQREQACLWGDDGKQCPDLIIAGKLLKCGTCGCPTGPDTPQSDLRLKWLMPKAICPRGLWQ